MISRSDLLDQIIEDSVDGRCGVAVLLRKCRLLSDGFENQSLTDWVLKELNGYEDLDELPSYRVIRSGAKGLFLGPLNAQLNAQPIASALLEKEHRHFAEIVSLRDPASAYENLKEEGESGYRIEWPGNLVLKYQDTFFEGYALNRAWQDLPVNALRTIPETVINRVLEFALSLKNELGEDLAGPTEAIKDQVDSAVVNILKGNRS